MIITTFILFLISCIILILAGTWLVRSLSGIASFLKMNEFIVAYIIMAFSTSLPELMVGILSGIQKSNSLALGTVIGSNIADITLILGIVTLVGKGIQAKEKYIIENSRYMIVIAIIPFILMIIGREISRWDGLVLIILYIIYMYQLVKRKGNKHKLKNTITKIQSIGYTLLFVLSMFLLFKSAEYVVFYGQELAAELLLPPILIGLFFVAIGTSLPELAFESRAVQKGHSEMALGDCIGSVVANSTLVLGVSAIINPITAAFNLFLISGIFMIFSLFLFWTFLESGYKLSAKEGIVLIFLYLLFVIIELTLKGVLA